MDIDTVFLDAGGVLVHPNWERAVAMFHEHGISSNASTMARTELEVMFDLDDPDIIRRTDDAQRLDRFMAEVFRRSNIDAPASIVVAVIAELKEYHRATNLWERVPPEVPDALARLRSHSLRLVVVSNANGTVRRLLERVGLASYMDLILDSFEEGVEKPDPRFFRIALDRAGAKAETTIHVGDFYHIDVVGARSAGMDAVLLDRASLHGDRDCTRVGDLRSFVEWLANRR